MKLIGNKIRDQKQRPKGRILLILHIVVYTFAATLIMGLLGILVVINNTEFFLDHVAGYIFQLIGGPQKIFAGGSSLLQEIDFSGNFLDNQNASGFPLSQDAIQEIIGPRYPQATFRMDDREIRIEEVKMTAAEIETLWRQKPQQAPDLSTNGLDIYLQETEEVQFSGVIRHQAAQLQHSPLKIFDFVKNEIAYEPYYGIKKGAEGTLFAKKGNDYDQAALLIALLRVGDEKGNHKFPARYVEGKALLELGQAMDFIGVEDAQVVAEVFASHNIPVKIITDQGGQMLFLEMRFVWVETYISYGYYLGLKEEGEKIWLPLVPFLDSTYYSHTVNITEEMQFDSFEFWEDYILNPQQLSPIEKYKNNIKQYLVQNSPGMSFEDVLIQRYPQKQNFEFLPLGLPFKVVQEIGKYPNIGNRRHKVRLAIEKDGVIYFHAKVDTLELFGGEIILDWEPASEEDQKMLRKFKSLTGIKPLSKIRARPILKSSGRTIRKGDSMGLGEEVNIYLDFLEPTGITGQPEVIEKTTKRGISGIAEVITIFMGDTLNPLQYGITVIGPGGHISYRPAHSRESLGNQMLYGLAIGYLMDLDKKYKELAGTFGSEVNFRAARAMVSNQIEVEQKNGKPYKFIWKGLTLNASVFADYYHRFGQERKEYLQEVALIGGLEAELDQAEIFERTFGVKSVSTIKGFNVINNGVIPGIEILKITEENSDEIFALDINEQMKQLFANEIENGSMIYISNKPATYHAWKGWWYIILAKNLVADYGAIHTL